jgi:uroporphyrinogen-III synthase/uroporphyrinogen III methyltransferase/synthase
VSDLPLSGRRILVTRSARQSGKQSDALRALGAEPVEVPVLGIVPPQSFDGLDEALCHLDRYDWLILTSTNTMQALCSRALRFGVRPYAAEGLKVAAIGRTTAEFAKAHGFNVDVVPQVQVAEALVEALSGVIRGKRVLLPRAEVARDVIPDALRAVGAQVDVVDAYRNVLPDSAPDQLREASQKKIDAATFTSSSSVIHLAEAARRAQIPFPFDGVPAISIGPVTSQTLREHGWPPAAEADPSDVSGLVAAVARFFASSSPDRI